jgi:hypothetical protein
MFVNLTDFIARDLAASCSVCDLSDLIRRAIADVRALTVSLGRIRDDRMDGRKGRSQPIPGRFA